MNPTNITNLGEFKSYWTNFVVGIGEHGKMVSPEGNERIFKNAQHILDTVPAGPMRQLALVSLFLCEAQAVVGTYYAGVSKAA